MKKTLLLGTFAIFGLMANAQLVTQSDAESLEAAGISGSEVAGGVVFASGEAGTIATAYTDTWKTTSAYGTYRTVFVNGEEVTLSTGAVGNTNPTFENYGAGVMSAGAVFEIKPENDGWLTVFTKLNPNKQYVVFEGLTGPMSYTLGYAGYVKNGDKYEPTTISYTLPHDEDYYIDFADYNVPGHVDDVYDDATSKYTYFVGAGGDLGTDMVKPNFPWKVVGFDVAPAENTGFVTFNVLGGNTYYFSALGSKAALSTMVLTEGEDEPVITFAPVSGVEITETINDEKVVVATIDLPEVTFGEGAGVESIEAVAADPNAPVYNVLGQKVGADAKGILIQNGKKFIRR